MMRLLLYVAATHASSNPQTTTSRPPPGPPKKPPAAAAVAVGNSRCTGHGAGDTKALEGLLLLRVTNWFGPVGGCSGALRPL